jgi:hypothetical protein
MEGRNMALWKRLTSMIGVRPCIGSMRKPTIRKMVYNAFVRVFFRTHEDETFGDIKLHM